MKNFSFWIKKIFIFFIKIKKLSVLSAQLPFLLFSTLLVNFVSSRQKNKKYKK